MMARIKNILAFALLGAVGFGIGGIVGAVIWGSPNSGQTFLSIALIGALGGASLGLGLRNWRKARVAALVGAVSFLAATLIALVIQLSLWGSSPPSFCRPLRWCDYRNYLWGIFGASLEGLERSRTFGSSRSNRVWYYVSGCLESRV